MPLHGVMGGTVIHHQPSLKKKQIASEPPWDWRLEAETGDVTAILALWFSFSIRWTQGTQATE